MAAWAWGLAAVGLGVGGVVVYREAARARVVAQRRAQVGTVPDFGLLAGGLWGIGGGLLGTVAGTAVGMPWLGALSGAAGGALGRVAGGGVDAAWDSYLHGDDLGA